MTTEQIQRLAEFKNAIQPLMKRFAQLPQDKREGFLESVLGAYISATVIQTGSMDEGCNRTHQLFEAMLVRQESPEDARTRI